jgi:hypothetical protein
MNVRVSLTLLLVTGCSAPASETGDSDPTATTTSQTASTTATSVGESDADTVTAPTGETGEAGTGTASGSGPATSEPTTEVAPTTGTANTDTIATTDTTDTTDTTASTDSTGGCMAMNGPAPVELGAEDNLGAPGAYVALAKTAITNVPGTSLVGGHVGISPAAESSITGFALALDPSGVFSTSPALAAPWRVYAADHVVPTPINLTTAVLAMQAAYTDAASRVPTDYLNLADGDIGGLVLAPGVYTWGSTVLIPEDVTLAGCDDDVWIFQIADNLDVSTGKRVLLSGGARAENVFWQIAGQATVHANAHVEGVLLSMTGITFQTGASLNGRALAQTMVAFDANAVTVPGP